MPQICDILKATGGVSMEKQVLDELNILKDIIVETVPVEQIMLFGSYAYGTPHKDSDLDLYVVLKDDIQMRELDAIRAIYRAIGDKKTMPVDVLAGKKSRFDYRKTGLTLERKIAREGMVLYG